MPEFFEQCRPIPLGPTENEVGEVCIEDFIDEGAVIGRLDGACAHDQVHLGSARPAMQVHENFRRALSCAHDGYPAGAGVPLDLAQVAV